MSEAAVSNEGAMEFQVLEAEIAQLAENMNQAKNITADGGGSAAADNSSSVVRWERFLPKLAVRVLLVEADDSTRQIIAALLRKCSYKVAAVSDGLKAWEVLKARSKNIDLILTEVELPSISGYALLTLIREHDICKNIPVIMMSSNDSVGTVYKCMLRGAADFLVKPVRKNELRNLWQHVWRRQAQSSAAGPGPPDESTAQQKVEATAENNATSNNSSDYMACIQRNRECIEKGSDAQSSCTKPEMETEGADAEDVLCLSPPKTAKFLSSDMNFYERDECRGENGMTRRACDSDAGGLQNEVKTDANCGTTQGQEKNNQMPVDSSRQAIDLIAAFDSYPKGNFDSPASNASTNKFDTLTLLDLSLRRSHPSSSVNQVNDETRRLNHSDASAFSRYINKPLQPRNSISTSTCNQQKDYETNSEKQQSNPTTDHNSDAHGSKISSHKYVSTAGIQLGQTETQFSYPLQRAISQPIPDRNLKFENVINGFGIGTVIPHLYCVQSGLMPSPSPGTTSHSPSFAHLNPFYHSDNQTSSSYQRFSSNVDPSDNKQAQKLEKLEEREHDSAANDQSGNSGFYSGNINSISVGKAISDTAGEEGFYFHDGTSCRSTQREVALTKFRMKRKDRCFEKKVRYESRKKLAEQRPRVKGQFVRQQSNDPQPGSSSAG